MNLLRKKAKPYPVDVHAVETCAIAGLKEREASFALRPSSVTELETKAIELGHQTMGHVETKSLQATRHH
ncbi:hypothetical protein AAC387_Pa09g0356 [Persea americana]